MKLYKSDLYILQYVGSYHQMFTWGCFPCWNLWFSSTFLLWLLHIQPQKICGSHSFGSYLVRNPCKFFPGLPHIKCLHQNDHFMHTFPQGKRLTFPATFRFLRETNKIAFLTPVQLQQLIIYLLSLTDGYRRIVLLGHYCRTLLT